MTRLRSAITEAFPLTVFWIIDRYLIVTGTGKHKELHVTIKGGIGKR
jgi:hypothetical protein